MTSGFPREKLRFRYDVQSFSEDVWHEYTGKKTSRILEANIPPPKVGSRLLLNAGAGVYQVSLCDWEDISVDLFESPIRNHPRSVCASVENLPFPDNMFGAIVCVGEVVGYCNPASAITEFARVLENRGTLIMDFGNTRGIRKWFTPHYAKAADVFVDDYNNIPESVWAYSPHYIKHLLVKHGFSIGKIWGTHTWSSIFRRCGMPTFLSVMLQRKLEWVPFPAGCADITTICATRCATEK